MSKSWCKLCGVMIVALLALPSCSGGVGINTVWDTQFDFAPGRTFDWAPQESESGETAAVDAAIRRAVEAELRERGFTRATSDPALLLHYYVGANEVTAIIDPDYYGPGWGAYWGYGWYGSGGANLSQYDDGTLTLDVLSTQPGIGLVFRGVAADQFDATMPTDQLTRAVESAVRRILEDFPPSDQ